MAEDGHNRAVLTSMWVGIPGSDKAPRFRVDFGFSGIGTAVFFDGKRLPFVRRVDFSATPLDRTRRVVELIQSHRHEPDANCVAYLDKCGVDVVIVDVGHRGPSFQLHEQGPTDGE